MSCVANTRLARILPLNADHDGTFWVNSQLDITLMTPKLHALDQPLSNDDYLKDKMFLLLLLDGSIVMLHSIVFINITFVMKPIQFFMAWSRVSKSCLMPLQQM